MKPIIGYYAPAYATDDSPLLARLAVAAERMQELGLVAFRQPQPLDIARLAGLHSERYLHAFEHGIAPLASSQGIPWTPAVRDATLAMLGGQLAAVDTALETGIALNLARGFHHAVPERGSGYCPINGLALVAKEHPDKRVFVIDCDEHGGNGTEEFAALLPNLFNFSIFGTRFGCRGGTRSWAVPVRVREQGFEAYRAALVQAGEEAVAQRADLILYQAGADCHIDDPKSRARLSRSELFHRDLMVFELARRHGIPLVFVVAGGYQRPDRVARLNINTVRAARWVYSR